MFTAIFLAGFLVVAAMQTPVTVVRITLLLLAALIGFGGGASVRRRAPRQQQWPAVPATVAAATNARGARI